MATGASGGDLSARTATAGEAVARPVGDRVLLMGTCLCDAFFPDAAAAAVEVLEHAGCEVLFPDGQTCCGQPAFNSGDWAVSRKVARYTAEVFAGDLPVVVPSGSCAAMHRHGNPLQFGAEGDRAVEALAARTWEICDYLVHGLGVETWPGDLGGRRVAVHHSCHTRGSATGAAVVALVGSIGGVEVVEFGQGDQCCGFGGTFSVTFPHVSASMGRLKLDHVLAAGPDELVSGDLSCLMHLGGLAEFGGRALPRRHVVELLAEALRARGGKGGR